MKYQEYLDEMASWMEMFGGLTDEEKSAYGFHRWLYVLADVTCETEGCIHGTQRVSFMEMGTGVYSSWCGHCNTQNFKIVGIFDDCEVVLSPQIHEDSFDPWVMNAAV